MKTFLSKRIQFFSDLVSCGQSLWMWEYDPALNIVNTNCENPDIYSTFLAVDPCKETLKEFIESGSTKPLMLYSKAGYSWIAGFEKSDNVISRIFVIGPAFNTDTTFREIGSNISYGDYPKDFMDFIRVNVDRLPIVPLAVWMQYGLMLHFCINEEKLEIGDLAYPVDIRREEEDEETEKIPEEGAWIAEQNALQMIETGNLDYNKAYSKLSSFSTFSVHSSAKNPLRRYKNYVICFMTLCSQAAIRGGLDYRIVYYLTEQYTMQVENSRHISDLMQINLTMYEDFVQRVHKIKAGSSLSRPIQICCNYIEMHLSEKLTLSDLMREAGYSGNHLSMKFKKETGMSVSDYIKNKRVEKAKLLLRTTSDSISDISYNLGFCNNSYFAQEFHSITGMTPGEYRDQKDLE